MNKFGTIPTSNNPAFGNNPAIASDKCYYLFLINIDWRRDKIGTNGLGELREKLTFAQRAALIAAGITLPDFGGSITKTCLCMGLEEALTLPQILKRFRLPSPPNADSNSAEGMMIIPRDCDCGGFFSRSKCVGHEEFEILGPGGQPLNINTGSWVTSTGDTRQFPGGHKKDILQDIINTELANSLPCCTKDKKSNSSSTSLGN
jgi:hypothetical protein